MKKYFLCSLLMIGVVLTLVSPLVSCSEEKKINLPYASVVDSLVMKYTSVDALSQYTGVPSSSLLAIKLGMSPEPIGITESLNQLLADFKEDRKKGLSILQNERLGLEYTLELGRVKVDLAKIEQEQNKAFQQALKETILDTYSVQAEEFIDDQFSFLTLPVVIWDYITKSEEEMIADWDSSLSKSISPEAVNVLLVKRLSAYTGLLNGQRKLLGFAEIKVPTLKLQDASLSFTTEAKQAIVKRAANETYSNLGSFFVELLIGLGIAAIIKFFMNKKIDAIAEAHAGFGYLIEKGTGGRSGFWSNLANAAGHMLNDGIEAYRIEKAREEANSRKRMVNICLTIIFFVVSFFLFDYATAEMENTITQEVYQHVSNYLSQQQMNIADYFL